MSENDSRQLILNAAEKLFYTKGYESTSMSRIQKETGLARGTLYYYFASKEEILDEVIARQGEQIFSRAEEISQDSSVKVEDRLLNTLLAIKVSSDSTNFQLDDLHSPRNVLLHKKINDYIVERATPFLTDIVKEGIASGIFTSEFPQEAVEMILIYVNSAFDHSKKYSEMDLMHKFMAMSFNIHRLLGAEQGSLDFGRILADA